MSTESVLKIVVNLKTYRDQHVVAAVLSECVMTVDGEKIRAIIEAYKMDDKSLLLGKEVNGALVGLFGIVKGTDADELKHIAICASHRGQGLGKAMVFDYMAENRVKALTAETDIDSVGFYRKIGFEVNSLGEKYPGRERFMCVLKR